MLKRFLPVVTILFLGFGAIYAQSDTVPKISQDTIRKEKKDNPWKLFYFLRPDKNAHKKVDTIWLDNGVKLVGEIKKMEQTVLTLKTSYSDSDFKIKWEKVRGISSNRMFVVGFEDGKRLSSTLGYSVENDKVYLDAGVNTYREDIYNVIYLMPIGKSFKSRMTAMFDIGVTLTKTNNLRQLTSSGSVSYVADKWNGIGSFSTVFSTQDDIDNVRRIDGKLNFQWILPKNWFLQPSVTFLSNDEQKLKLRTTTRLGGGYFFKHSNISYLGAFAGLGYNHETYTNDENPTSNSLESYIGGMFKKFKIGDLRMDTSLLISPGLSEWGRIRVDFNFDLKYDLPWDFYIKTSFTYNFDNRPVAGASKDDYVFQTSFGWELK